MNFDDWLLDSTIASRVPLHVEDPETIGEFAKPLRLPLHVRV